jgi:hypothetical protein
VLSAHSELSQFGLNKGSNDNSLLDTRVQRVSSAPITARPPGIYR